jgi:hypothetical protein
MTSFWLSGRFLADSGARLGQTLVRGAGTTAWAGSDPSDIVVRIPIPKSLKTTSFDLDDDARLDALERGRRAATNLRERIDAAVAPSPK